MKQSVETVRFLTEEDGEIILSTNGIVWAHARRCANHRVGDITVGPVHEQYAMWFALPEVGQHFRFELIGHGKVVTSPVTEILESNILSQPEDGWPNP